MPSPWSLRRRPKDPEEEDAEQLQDRYAARLEQLLRPGSLAGRTPPDEESPGLDEADDAAGAPQGSGSTARTAAPGARRVPLRIGPDAAASAEASRGSVGSDGAGLVAAPGMAPVGGASSGTDAGAAPGEVAGPTATGSGTAAGRRRATAGESAPSRDRTTGGTKSGSRSRTGTPTGRKRATRSRAVKPPRAAPAACPYCAQLLEPPPPTSRRCPRCRQRIVVRRAGGRAVYLTEAALPVYEAERARAVEHARFVRPRDRWLALAADAGAPEDRRRRLGEGLATSASVDASRKLFMASVDRAFRAAKREHRWEDAERIRREQAAALDRVAGRPRPPAADAVALYREGVAARLRGLSEVVREAELKAARCCGTCAADDGATFRIASELRTPRLPHPGCPAGLCRCQWTVAAKDLAALRRLTRGRPRAGDAGPRSPR